MLSDESTRPRYLRRIAIGAFALSVALVGVLAAVYFLYGSQLALSQAADSLADTLTQGALLLSIFIASRPADEEHHYGHHRAEPIAALVAAVMIGVVSIEVVREAVGAIVSGDRATLHWSLPVVFGAKGLAKLVLAFACARADQTDEPNPALRAIYVDARNDAVLSVLSVAGFFAATYGLASLDAYLAIPIGLWIGWSAVDLARDTMPLLMGQAPSEERQAELRETIRGVEGVRRVWRMRVQHVGTELDIDVHVVVDPELSLRAAHAIGREVEERLVEQSDICHAMVHVEPEGEPSAASSPSRRREDEDAAEE